jgi:acyl-coenzyme A synthetase/AMP-(fatty) acid ligase
VYNPLCRAGEPKAIPWTHVTPLRCGVDAWAQQDVRRGDVVAWPTNLGWMMGPWLLYSALLNGAAVALFQVSAALWPFLVGVSWLWE